MSDIQIMTVYEPDNVAELRRDAVTDLRAILDSEVSHRKGTGLGGPNEVFQLHTDVPGWELIARALAGLFGAGFATELGKRSANAMLDMAIEVASRPFPEQIDRLRTMLNRFRQAAELGFSAALSIPYLRNHERNAALVLNCESNGVMLAQLSAFARFAPLLAAVLEDQSLHTAGVGLKLDMEKNADGSSKIVFTSDGTLSLKARYFVKYPSSSPSDSYPVELRLDPHNP